MTVSPIPAVRDEDPPLFGFTFGGRLWGWMIDPIVQCIASILVVSIVFVAVPGIDVWVSGLFAAPDKGGFPVARLPAFQILRDANRWLTWIIPIALIVVMVVKLVRPDRPSLVPPAKSFFLLLTLAVGSGIIANLIFKNNWGRPRPSDVDLFGGTLPFVPAWQVTDYCPANCSFISGEGSSALWLLGLAVLLPVAVRSTAVKWIAVFVVAVSLNRIAFGGHFLSDVLLAWGFTGLVMVLAYRFLIARPIPWLANDRQEARWTTLGVWIRRRLGFPTAGRDQAARDAPAPVVPALPREREAAAER